MLGFGRKPVDNRNAYEKIVDDAETTFDGFSDGQRRAFVGLIIRLFPQAAAESQRLEALPIDAVITLLKRSFWALVPHLAFHKEKALRELGQAFFRRGQRMREYCAQVARELQAQADAQALMQKAPENDNGQPV
jgi:hypothetical protein